VIDLCASRTLQTFMRPGASGADKRIELNQERRARNPISLAAYKLFREMGRRGAMPLDAVARRMGWKDMP
jgi:hypothetical protein